MKLILGVFFVLFYFLSIYVIWQFETGLWVKLVYSFIGLPLLLLLSLGIGVVAFARFLPALDLTVGNRQDRTVRNDADNYESTFLQTSRDTNGAYELIQVEVEPKGGNSWHYHKSFDEQFTVLTGQLTIGLNGKTMVLKAGETATAPKKSMHYFHNDTTDIVLLQVKATPAKGLEKSIRIAYGLNNTGQWGKGMFPKNPWHLPLLLGYSETYLPNIPKFIQEPLVNALAKIAQWKGEDKDLEVFFK
ncbi:cupin domain-containing protein [Rhodocytophaga rosea]|uniref:Cupin domain-containing protein n=2 Tax=Rhodocytophaga rosea TaxID=2704465 RepID=A0A6C0GVB7_9BACT|nr:cupin domain-containing protein [Rhodocytophaga rosea]